MSRVCLDVLIKSDESGFACSKTKLVESGLPHLRPFNVSNDGRLDLSEVYQVPETEAPLGKTYLDAGDILFNNTNSAELVGKSALVQSPMRAGFSNHMNRIRLDTNQIEPAYFAFWLKRQRDIGFFTSQATQWVSQAAYKTSEMRKLEIELPTLPEQRRIVDLLSRAEGIVRLRREAEKKAAELIPALFLDMFGDPATNPKGWAEKPLEEVSEISYGIADKLDSTLTAADGYRILTISNVLQEGRIDPTVERYCKATEAQIKKSLVQRGDLLFNWRNGSETHIGKTAIWEHDDSVLHVSFLLRIRSVVAATNPYYLWAMLNLLRQQGFFIGVSRQQINRKFNASELSALVLPTPPIDKQKMFAEKMELIRGIQSQQSIASSKAQAAFDVLLAQAFSG